MGRNSKVFLFLSMISLLIVAPGLNAQPRIPKEMIPPDAPADVRTAIEGLYSSDPAERADQIVVLSQMHEKAAPAIPFLVGMLGDWATLVWLPDARIFVKVEKFPEQPLKITELGLEYIVTSVDREAAKALARIGPQAVDPLIVSLVSALKANDWNDWIDRSPFILRIDRMHEVSAPKAKDWIVPANAAMALGLLRAPEAVGPLIAILRAWETIASGRATDRLAVERLMDLVDIHEADRFLKADVMAALSMTSVLKDARLEVVRMTAFALGQIADRGGQDSLIQDVWRVWYQEPEKGAKVLALGMMEDSLAARALIGLLGHRDPAMRSIVARLLGPLKNRRSVMPLITLLKDKESILGMISEKKRYVRGSACASLGAIGDPRAVEHLVAMLQDDEEDVRTAAVVALGDLGGTRALQSILSVMKDEESEVRAAAAQALGLLGDARGIEPLLVALKDEESEVRSAASDALGRLGDERGVEPLLSAARDEDQAVRFAAVRALGCFKDPRAVDGLIALLRDQDSEIHVATCRALSHTGDHRAVKPLVSALQYSPYMHDVAEALGDLKDSAAVEPLISFLKIVRADSGEWHPPSVAGFNDFEQVIRIAKNRDLRVIVRTVMESLRKITGQKFSDNVDQWIDWWDRNKDKPANVR